MAKTTLQKNMEFKNKAILTLSVIAALSIILSAYILNGSEFEDAWLYITGVWIIVFPLFDLYSNKKRS